MARGRPAGRPPTRRRPAVPRAAYRGLEARFRRLAALGEAISVLHWDSAVMMPPGGAAARAEQVAALKVLRHELLTDPAVAEALAEAAAEVAADRSPAAPWRAANLREMRRAYVHAAGVPSDLLEAHSKACAACEMAWRDARPANDFAAVAPLLAEVVRLTRGVAAAKARALAGAISPRGSTPTLEPLRGSSLPHQGRGGKDVDASAPSPLEGEGWGGGIDRFAIDPAGGKKTLSTRGRAYSPSQPSPARGEGEGSEPPRDVAPYDALLDQWEPGARSVRIDPLFADLAAFLPDFLERALARQAAAPAPVPLGGPFAVEAQRDLARRLMAALGFDFAHGRLDVSPHPFCGGVPEDVRITTRYDPADFTQSLMGVLHETGHALYERGLPAEWRRQPVGRARGMALHESQSLLVEMQACRSPEFVAFLAPRVAEAFALDAATAHPDNLHRHYARIARGFIRVDADEATYPLHVILRYRLEQALIAGDLAVADLPGAWNDGMRALLGVVPPTDALGCLQDIHWYDGAFGYFPTYTMGALAAAQLYAAARAARPDIPDRLRHGDFAPLMAWLRERVHRQGSLPATTDDLLADVTGAPLDPAPFKRHLEARYLG